MKYPLIIHYCHAHGQVPHTALVYTATGRGWVQPSFRFTEEHVGIRVILQNQKRLGSYDSFFLCAAAWHSHSDRSTAVHATTHSHSRQNCTSTGSMLNLRGCGRHTCKYGWHGQRERESSPHIRAHIPHFSLRATASRSHRPLLVVLQLGSPRLFWLPAKKKYMSFVYHRPPHMYVYTRSSAFLLAIILGHDEH
jgi:hypothetical protein